MTRYVAIPKFDHVREAFAQAGGDRTPQARVSRIGALMQARRGGADGMFNMSLDAQFDTPAISRVIARPTDRTPVSGVTIIESDTHDREALQNEMPDYDIVEDFFLGAPEPHRSAPGVASGAGAAVDTWHLDAVRLGQARAGGFSGKGEGVGIAVLDTGIRETDEIQGRISSAWEIATDYTVREIASKDTSGHGTLVASLIAGKTVGVAPAANLLNFIMIPHDRGTYVNFILALEFVARRPEISIVNMSAGIVGWEPRMRPAIQGLVTLGILPVIAIGNEGPDQSRSPGNYPESLSVGATNKDGGMWAGSGSGRTVPEDANQVAPILVAPGQDVTACAASGAFEIWSGTSMASPIVSGVAALIIEKFPDISIENLRQQILTACRRLADISEDRQGFGLLQVPTHMVPAGA